MLAYSPFVINSMDRSASSLQMVVDFPRETVCTPPIMLLVVKYSQVLRDTKIFHRYHSAALVTVGGNQAISCGNPQVLSLVVHVRWLVADLTYSRRGSHHELGLNSWQPHWRETPGSLHSSSMIKSTQLQKPMQVHVG